MEEIEMYLQEAVDSMEKAIKHTNIELSKIRAGKASPAMLEGIRVDYYGSSTPLTQVASVNTSDARTIVIKPFEKSLLAEIEKVIRNSELRLNPMNDGEIVRIVIPPLTEERRRDLVRQAKSECEQGKVAIRNVRKEINEALRKLMKEGVSEDDVKKAETKVQTLTDNFVKKIEEIFVAKEADIMTV